MSDKDFEKYWDSLDLSVGGLKDLIFEAWKAGKGQQDSELATVKPMALNHGKYYIGANLEVYKISELSSHSTAEHGRERETKEQAEFAAKKISRRDRLHAFVTQCCCYEYDFVPEECNWWVVFNHITGKFSVSTNHYVFEEVVGAIYMPEATARYLCDALNDGRLVL